ncbi:hypothetical protein BS78_K302100 [Paspalum vaginatum]|uniref:Uncharacterized protein n=1 Tax=Paspalum vaginatum TaxID=158149 RepID=A0A9W8CD69_9POAL|nr:hypothetical protein BS78_K302100 [Paspalum vaginatum]
MRFLYKARTVLLCTLMVATGSALLLAALFIPSIDDVPEYTVGLAAFRGLNNATLGRTVSPAFDLTAWCHNHGELVVSYAGVALAWGRVPALCVPRRSSASFTVVTWGKGVYLSDELRQRLTTEWRAGTAKAFVDMKLHYYPNNIFIPIVSRPGTVSISHELMLGDTREIQINVL